MQSFSLMRTSMRRCGALLAALGLAGCAVTPAGTPPGRFSLREQTFVSPQDFYRALGEEATPYLASDLREVERSTYEDREPGGEALTLERLVVGSSPEALGLFNRLRSREKPVVLRRWPFGYLTDDRFVAVRGAVLLRVTTSAGRGEAALALAIESGAGPNEGGMPSQVTALQALGVDPWDISWEADALLGSPALAPGVSAPLPGGPAGSRVVLLAKATPTDANAALLAFLDGTTGGGQRGISFTIGVGDIAAGVRDALRGWVSIARRGNVIAGTSGLSAADDGWPWVSRLLAALEEGSR